MKLLYTLLFLLALQLFADAQSRPRFTASVGGQEGGNMSRGSFLVQQGVGGLWHVADDHWERLQIDSFSLLVQRDTTILFNRKNKGNLFEPQLTERMKMILAGDRVLVYNIYGRDVDGKVVLIRPLEFIIE